MSPSKAMLSKKELAQLLNVSLSLVDIWRRTPGLSFPKPAIQIGKVLRWRRSDVEAWLGHPLPDEPEEKTRDRFVIGGRVLLTRYGLAHLLDVGSSTADQIRKLPDFPKPVQLARQRPLLFDLEEVESWIARNQTK